MFCPNCGNQISDDAVFCPNCGFRKDGQGSNNNATPNNQKRTFNIGKIIVIVFVLGIVFVLFKFVLPSIMNLFETAKILQDEHGNEYYQDKEGNVLFNQWVVYKGKEYHLDNKGYIDKNRWIDDYYVDAEGIKVKDDWIKDGQYYYYLKSDGKYAHSEIIEIDHYKYGFNDQGVLYTGTFFYDPQNYSKRYYANSDGVIQIDSFADINGFTYYFGKDGEVAANGWNEINNEWYYFTNTGELFKSTWIDGKYYVDENGRMIRNAKAPNGIELDGNGEIIPGQSMIEGTVIMLTGGNSILRIIEGAEVSFYDTKNLNEKIGTTYTDGQGKYQYYLRKGNYKIEINADGYETIDSIETINENENKYTELVSLFPSGQVGNGTAAGRITNAIDGRAVANATLKVRRNWNNTSGELATSETFFTDANGNFIIGNLPVGYYTVEASKDKFITGYSNIALLSNNPVIDYYFSINPEMPNDGNVRVVLTWGANPSDLDSHLIGRKPNGNYFDVYYASKVYNYNNTAMANLDVDDTSSYGPETETITSDINGTYVYGVHDYTNGSSTNSTSLSYSNCKVTVYMGSHVVAIYNVPTGKVGTFWEVFRINEDRSIVPINQIYNYNPTSNDYSRFGIQERTNPKYSSYETTISSNSSNNSSSSSRSSSSNNSSNSSSSGGYTISYESTINEKYDYDDDNEVNIKIRKPRISGSSTTRVESINNNIEHALDELIMWCQEYIDNAIKTPRTINLNTAEIYSSNSSEIKIRIKGVITFKGSTDTNDVSFMFTYNFNDDDYTIVKQ